MGIGLMLATILMLLNFFIVMGLVTLPHLSNSVFLWLWISFLATSLVSGGLGLKNLICSGFFRKLKERELRLKFMKVEDERRLVSEPRVTANIHGAAEPGMLEHVSVTEATTRELEERRNP
jgi:hypothetical protein